MDFLQRIPLLLITAALLIGGVVENEIGSGSTAMLSVGFVLLGSWLTIEVQTWHQRLRLTWEAKSASQVNTAVVSLDEFFDPKATEEKEPEQVSSLSERLLDRVRMDLGDLDTPFDFEVVGDGTRDHFNIEHRPINPDSLVLAHDGEVVVDPGFLGIYLDYDAGVLVFQTPPDVGELWELQGKKWRYFSDDDLQLFIDTALIQHSHNRGDDSGGDFTIGDIKPVEEYPVALLAVIQALWALATDAAFDIDILSPDGVNIPRSERYRQLMEIISARKQQYDEMAAALNIGINAIEVFTLRRTAKLTNRLVPVVLPQEYDDSTRAKRILYPPILLGTEPVKTGIGTYDVDIISGSPKAFTLDFAFDLTGAVIQNAIRSSPISSRTGSTGPPLMEWTQEVIDAPNGKVRLSLTGAETRRLPYNALWEIQVQKAGETEFRPFMRGLIRASNNEVVR